MALIILVAPGLLLLFDLGVVLWVVPLLLLAFFVLRNVMGAPLRRWLVPTQLLAQTRWTELALRIKEWSKLLHLPIKDCELAHTRPSGYPIISMEGWPEPSVFLSDAFLEASDWRQQYAALALRFGYRQERVSRWQSIFLFIAAQSFLLVAAYWLLGNLLLREGPSLIVIIADVFARIFVMTFLANWIVNTLITGYRFPSWDYRADHFAAKLTGDPKAVMAALHTLGSLANNPASMAARLRRLSTSRAEAGYRAPWADAPVPAGIPLTIEGETLTTPLDPPDLEGSTAVAVYPPLILFDDTRSLAHSVVAFLHTQSTGQFSAA
jgi:hypothetical protein